jgi:carbonic anhydrase
MNDLLTRAARFRDDIFPAKRATYESLAHHGQAPKALMISCADSRVVPEFITQCEPGELFVARNAGNIVPPYSNHGGGVSTVIEYAIKALGVRDVVVCGHSGCGAMKALLTGNGLAEMPTVASWLQHAHAAQSVVCDHFPGDRESPAAIRALELENIIAQLQNLRTHPAVSAALANGNLALHGWYFDVSKGEVWALDGSTNRFYPLDDQDIAPVAVAASRRCVEGHAHNRYCDDLAAVAE